MPPHFEAIDAAARSPSSPPRARYVGGQLASTKSASAGVASFMAHGTQSGEVGADGSSRYGGVLASMLLIAAVKLSLACLGFAKTLRWVCHPRHRAPFRRELSTREIADIQRGVALAAAFYPGRAACLERSLVLYRRLRRRGTDAELRFGVQSHPFAAHAWVAYHGEPINDSPEHVAHFAPMPEVVV